MNDVLVDGFLEILGKYIIGRSTTYPCGWISTEDLRKIADEIDSGKYDKLGNEVCEYDK